MIMAINQRQIEINILKNGFVKVKEN